MRPLRAILLFLLRATKRVSAAVLLVLALALIAIAVTGYVRGKTKWDVVSATRVAGDDTDSRVHIVQLQSTRGRVCLFTAGEAWRVGAPALEPRYWNRGWVVDHWSGPLEGEMSKPAAGQPRVTTAVRARPDTTTAAADIAAPARAAVSVPPHGFHFHADVRKVGPNDRWVRRLWMPHWAMAAAGGLVLLALLARRAVRKSRMKRGLCGNCAYDLRASHTVCPRCGARFTYHLFHTGGSVDAA